MEEENDFIETLKGIISSILIFSAIAGINIFMLWLLSQIFG